MWYKHENFARFDTRYFIKLFLLLRRKSLKTKFLIYLYNEVMLFITILIYIPRYEAIIDSVLYLKEWWWFSLNDRKLILSICRYLLRSGVNDETLSQIKQMPNYSSHAPILVRSSSTNVKRRNERLQGEKMDYEKVSCPSTKRCFICSR